MKIKVGIGTDGNIFKELEEVKACNFCSHFKGYGLHAFSGHCFKLDKDIRIQKEVTLETMRWLQKTVIALMYALNYQKKILNEVT